MPCVGMMSPSGTDVGGLEDGLAGIQRAVYQSMISFEDAFAVIPWRRWRSEFRWGVERDREADMRDSKSTVLLTPGKSISNFLPGLEEMSGAFLEHKHAVAEERRYCCCRGLCLL